VEKFKTLDSLNEHWATSYWSQSYSAWEQIPIPKSGHNPGLMLAFQQTDLDIASWDWYVPIGHPDYTETGAAHDLVRGFKRRNFWLMETQPGNVNWAPISNHTNKGECRAMAWHAVGHGADAVLYWQWRSALNGQEQYHSTLVDQSGQPRLLYEEVAQIESEFKKVSALFSGSKIKAQVAILNDYNSRWSLDWSRQHEDFNYVDHLRHYYKPFAKQNIPVDIISADEKLDGYRLVIAPGLVILNSERVQHLTEYVERGGTLVLTLRFGMKDEFNSLLPMRQPGPLTKLTNAEVEEYYPLDTPVTVQGKIFTGSSKLWAERLRILDDSQYTQTVASYGKHNGWLDDQIAITYNTYYNTYSRGGVYYIGAYLDDQAQTDLFEHICGVVGIKPLMFAPRGVEICQRVTLEGHITYLLINHQNSPKMVTLPWAAREHLSGFTGKGELTLSPYGVAILTKEA
jgi:beta-galactosidase